MLEFEDRRHQQRRRPAASPARSPRRCSCAASSTRREGLGAFRHLRLDADAPSPARPEGGECQAARALYALLARALRLNEVHAHSIRASRRPGPISRRRHLEGKVEAARFVEGHVREVVDAAGAAAARALARRAARDRGAQGRARHRLRENDEGWAWGQLAADGYVGWLPANALARARRGADPQGLGAAHAGVSRPVDQAAADRGAAARRAARDVRGTEAALRGDGHRALRAGARTSRRSTSRTTDFVAVAERFLGSPYLWGGKTTLGIDCSGLVQVALNGLRHRLPARQRHAGRTGLGRG